MKTHLKVLTLACAVALPLFLLTRANQADPAAQEVMREKLLSAQKVLEGLALEDFKLIGTHAKRLSSMSKVAGWRARQTPEYELFTTEFRRHADRLARSADQNNLDGATVAYLQMTGTCIDCHKYMRGDRAAALDSPLFHRVAEVR